MLRVPTISLGSQLTKSAWFAALLKILQKRAMQRSGCRASGTQVNGTNHYLEDTNSCGRLRQRWLYTGPAHGRLFSTALGTMCLSSWQQVAELLLPRHWALPLSQFNACRSESLAPIGDMVPGANAMPEQIWPSVFVEDFLQHVNRSVPLWHNNMWQYSGHIMTRSGKLMGSDADVHGMSTWYQLRSRGSRGHLGDLAQPDQAPGARVKTAEFNNFSLGC